MATCCYHLENLKTHPQKVWIISFGVELRHWYFFCMWGHHWETVGQIHLLAQDWIPKPRKVLAQKYVKFVEMANSGSHDLSLQMWKRSSWYMATVIHWEEGWSSWPSCRQSLSWLKRLSSPMRAKSREHFEDTAGHILSVPNTKICMWLRTKQGCGHCASLGTHLDFHL